MCEIISCTGQAVEIRKEEVFRDLCCTQKSAAYEVFEQEYEELLEPVISCCRPQIYLKECRLPKGIVCGSLQPGEQILCGLYTVGREISNWSTRAFFQEDYVKGMLLDAMADCALFSMEKQMESLLRSFCRERGVGIAGRFHAQEKNVMFLQRFLYEELEGEKNGFFLTAGYMFDPVKTGTVIFRLTADADAFCAHHTCSGCENYSCKRRKTTIFQN